MKVLKIVGIVVAALVLVVIAAIVIVASRFDANRFKSEAEHYVYQKTHRTLGIAGPVDLSFWPNIGVAIDKVSLSEPDSNAGFATVDRVRIALAVMPLLSGKMVVHEIRINGLELTLIRHKDGRLNVTDLISPGKPTPPATKARTHAGAAPVVDIAAIHIGNASVVWRDEQSGTLTKISGLNLDTGRVRADATKHEYSVAKLSLAMSGEHKSRSGNERFTLKLEVPELSVTPQASAGKRATLELTLAGPGRELEARLALTGLTGKGDTLNAEKLAAEIDGKFGDADVAGKLAGKPSVNLGRQTVRLANIDGGIDVTDARIPAKRLKLPLSGAVHADLRQHAAGGQLAGSLDRSKFALKFSVTKFSPPVWNFDAGIDRLDVDRYLPAQPSAPPAAAKTPSPAPAGADRLDFSAIDGLNLTGALHVGQFQAKGLRLTDLRVRLKAADGRLALAPIAAKLYGGTANGNASFDAKHNALALKARLTGVRIGPLLADVAHKDIVKGHGNIALDLTARGPTLTALKKALAGSARLSLKDGAIKGINLAQSLRDLKAKFGAGQNQVVASRAADKTDFTELSASFKIAGGVAHNDDLSAKSPFLRLSGNGDIDIGNDRLDYLLKTSVVATAGGQGGKELAHLKGLTVPVRLTGPIEHPSWNIEFSGLAREAAKQKAQELKQNLEQKLQDRLRKLF